jgi:regulator of protease activity HflC (stomatin/prohibitin superfamily)
MKMERYDLEEFRKELHIPMGMVKKKILWGAGAILGLVSLWGTVGTVGAGERGVLLRFGAVTGTIFDEGLYFKIPFCASSRPDVDADSKIHRACHLLQ